MTEPNKYIAAVDLGTTKVAIAVGRKAENNKIEILSVKEVHSEGVIKGDLKNLEQAASAIREVKAQIEKELSLTLSQVLVGISGQHIKCINDTGNVFVRNSNQGISEITAEDVQNLISLMHRKSVGVGKTIINVLPQIYKVDEESDISEPVGMEGKRLEAKFNIIVGEESAIERVRRCFERVGMQMIEPVLQPLASAEAVLSEDEKELGVAVIDIGGGTTDLCIYYDKIIRHIAVIPIGGNIVNKDIKSIGVLNKHIEKLKTTFGEAIASKTPAEKYIKLRPVSGQPAKEVPLRTLACIIEARMYDIIDLVKIEIERGTAGVKLGAGIVLTGGGANLKNLDLLFRSKLQTEVRVASPTTQLTAESLEKVASPKFSTLSGIMVDALRRNVYTDVEVIEQPVVVEPVAAAPTPTPETTPYQQESLQQNQMEGDMEGYNQQEYAQDEYNQGGYNTQGGYAADEYEGYEDDYDDEPTVTKRKRGLFSKLRDKFSKMVSDEEIDDDQV
ncbi:MAG: cell division protein FtsA [Rikenellaceae bacterium]